MERGSNKHGPMLEEEMDKESQPMVRGGPQEGHVEEEREKESAGEPTPGPRIAGSGSSADEHSWDDHGEKGGASHPKPKEE